MTWSSPLQGYAQVGSTVKIYLQENSGLITYWQKFGSLKPQHTRTCLAKQDKAGSCRLVTLLTLVIAASHVTYNFPTKK